tara:strand:- start:3541 stop:4587 length:1047 start_codon:yes stop_codon:yes gene_type:complete
MMTAMSPTTVAEKKEAEKQMKEEQRRIGQTIDRLAAASQAEQDAMVTGCGGTSIVCSIARRMSRMLGISRPVQTHATMQMDETAASSLTSSGRVAAGSSSNVRTSASTASRVFGVAKQKVDPSLKLEQAAVAMRARVAQLDSRAEEARTAAAKAAQSNKRPLALRELKKAKALEAQALSTQSALDALEAQSDMLEQTALHREVAGAIGETAKSLKKDKKLLNRAEDAVEAAGELRDLHSDITSVMGELGDHSKYDYDDDDLLAELESMVQARTEPAHGNDEAPRPAGATGQADEDAEQTAENVRKARLELERRHAMYDSAEEVRRGLPAAPTEIKKKETQGLLHSAAC